MFQSSDQDVAAHKGVYREIVPGVPQMSDFPDFYAYLIVSRCDQRSSFLSKGALKQNNWKTLFQRKNCDS